MPTKILNDIELNNRYVEAIDKYLAIFFRDKVYKPLHDIVVSYHPVKYQNAGTFLQEAILKGKVSYYRGYFTGGFNSRISRELLLIGAKLTRKGWKLPKSKLPDDIRMALSLSESSWLKVADKINSQLDSIIGADFVEDIDFTGLIDKAIFSLNRDIEKDLKGISVAPVLSETNVKDIAEKYTNNMKYYVKDFTESEIVKLRNSVKENTLSGHRYEGLAKDIQKSFNISKSKANFLARQETNLLVAKFKESRYTEMGINEYVWQTVVGSPAHPVRPMHKALNGTVQRFDNPPVVNERGDRKNPKEDYGCRCKARPVVRF